MSIERARSLQRLKIAEVTLGHPKSFPSDSLPGGAFESVGSEAELDWWVFVVGYDLISAFAFRAEHAFVGKGKETGGIFPVTGECRKAHADGDLHLFATMRNRHAVMGDALTQRIELLAPPPSPFLEESPQIPRRRSGRRCRYAEKTRAASRRFSGVDVARSMAVIFIQHFEAIHIDDREGELFAIAAGAQSSTAKRSSIWPRLKNLVGGSLVASWKSRWLRDESQAKSEQRHENHTENMVGPIELTIRK